MRTYDADFKIEAVKLANEIGATKAAKELNMPSGTLDTWVYKAKNGTLAGVGTPQKTAISLAEENKRLKQENRELKRANDILSKAAAFFAHNIRSNANTKRIRFAFALPQRFGAKGSSGLSKV